MNLERSFCPGKNPTSKRGEYDPMAHAYLEDLIKSTYCMELYKERD